MTDKALENAEVQKKQLVERRLKLHSEIVDIDRQIGVIDNFIVDWHMFASGQIVKPVDKSAMDEQNESASTASEPKRAARNSRKEEVAEATRAIILERGEPVSRDDLYGILIDRGFRIHGRDPQMVLSTMLWRTRDEFGVIHLRNVGYWLREKEYPDARYYPELEAVMGAEDEAPQADEYEDDEDSQHPAPPQPPSPPNIFD